MASLVFLGVFAFVGGIGYIWWRVIPFEAPGSDHYLLGTLLGNIDEGGGGKYRGGQPPPPPKKKIGPTGSFVGQYKLPIRQVHTQH